MAPDQKEEIALGIEGGGTRTTVLLVDAQDTELASFQTGPANLKLMAAGELQAHLEAIKERLPVGPHRIGIGLAGAWSEANLERLRSATGRVWPGIPCAPSDDLMTALEASEWRDDCPVQVLVLSGTGSCSLGRHRNGERVKVGGRGHILGDRASACQIAQHALRSVMTISDSSDEWPRLGADILAHLQMNEPDDLIEWSIVATKTELASVAIPVFRAAETREDEIALAVLDQAAERLSKDSAACADRMAQPDERVHFVLNGAVLLKNRLFAEDVTRRLLEKRPNAIVDPLDRPSVWGAVVLARKLPGVAESASTSSEEARSKVAEIDREPAFGWSPVSASPTEQRHPRSMNFSDLSILEGIALMLQEDATIPQAVLAESGAIEWTVQRVVRAFAEGGRLIYAGAGSSGRLGVLDASECPPTFRAPAAMVQGIMAGGRPALWSAVEGAEDDPVAGRSAIVHRSVSHQDVVIGISASGHAPFAWGCLKEAKERGAATVLLSCNPAYRNHPLLDQAITPDTGAELLAGSTRLKAGTATKLVLNIITTLAMTHSGKVLSNLMIDLDPSNSKLRDRAVRIVREVTNASESAARSALKASGWVVRDACSLAS